MLLRFLVENFRSFHGEETLSLVPAKSRIHRRHELTTQGPCRRARGLPLAVLYGANASGKSNLIRAMDFARTLIVLGTRADAPTGAVGFRLDPDSASKPSRFEFVLTHEGVLYTYGFAVDEREVTEEWLFAVFDKQEVRLFERRTEGGSARLEFGSRLAKSRDERQRLQFVASGTRPNQLFLTEANDRNVQALAPLIHWFRDHFTIIWPDAQYRPLVPRAHSDEQFADFLAAFLRVADTGISGLDRTSREIDVDHDLPNLTQEMKGTLLDGLQRSPDHSVILSAGKVLLALHQEPDGTTRSLTLQTEHVRSDGKTVLFNTQDESDGTHRLINLVPALLSVQNNEDVFVIDELDRSLHPHLCRLYLEAFLRGVAEHNNRGQMILTTHETTLLDLDVLRRDEIWFVEKDAHGASHLTSLAEFKLIRADLRIDKGYLGGRFGAIPLVGDVTKLLSSGGAA